MSLKNFTFVNSVTFQTKEGRVIIKNCKFRSSLHRVGYQLEVSLGWAPPVCPPSQTTYTAMDFWLWLYVLYRWRDSSFIQSFYPWTPFWCIGYVTLISVHLDPDRLCDYDLYPLVLRSAVCLWSLSTRTQIGCVTMICVHWYPDRLCDYDICLSTGTQMPACSKDVSCCAQIKQIFIWCFNFGLLLLVSVPSSLFSQS